MVLDHCPTIDKYMENKEIKEITIEDFNATVTGDLLILDITEEQIESLRKGEKITATMVLQVKKFTVKNEQKVNIES